ncbi:phosphomannomutase/phosphoglucomutase [Sesbania bispinosa]|nr:phosphomannomutase/phosphoglucomutase [Sesbania bispinosa]
MDMSILHLDLLYCIKKEALMHEEEGYEEDNMKVCVVLKPDGFGVHLPSQAWWSRRRPNSLVCWILNVQDQISPREQ